MTKFYWNKEANLEFASGMKKRANNLADRQGKMKSDFKDMVDAGLADITVSDMSKSMDKMSGLSNDTSDLFVKCDGEVTDAETMNANEIDTMKIPTDFVADNATEVNYYNSVLLSKIDGRSVTEGKATEKVEDVKDSEVVREALDNINNNVTQQQNLDGSSSIVGQSILENINGNITDKKELSDATRNINSAEIKNINENVTDKQEVGNETGNINNGVVRNISGKTTNYVDSDVSTSIVGDSILENINGNKAVEKQELDDKDIADSVTDNGKNEDENKKVNELNELNNNSMGEDKKVIA